MWWLGKQLNELTGCKLYAIKDLVFNTAQKAVFLPLSDIAFRASTLFKSLL